MVGQLALQMASVSSLVMITGPPAFPPGSIVPDSAMSRLGWVGPMTEQW